MSENLLDLKEIKTDNIKCKSCGANMVFDPDTQTLKCEHCNSVIDIQKNTDVYEHDILEGFEKAERWEKDEQATYRCQNCGAVVVVNADEEAVKCPFCSTTHIVKEGSFNGIKPQAILPFTFGKETAEQKAKKWAKSKIFAPREFKKKLSAENLHGVYEPCFTFDSLTSSYFYGRVGDYRTRTVGSGKNRRTERYLVYRNVSGHYNKFFDDVLVATNDNFSQMKLHKLLPYNTKNAEVYQKKYLSGFVAEGYDKDVRTSWQDAKKIMNNKIRDSITASLHCDVVESLHVSTSHEDVTYKYLLVPVYMLNYHFKKKDYNINVNGTTGKVAGKTPVSAIKVIIAVLLGLTVIVGGLMLSSAFNQSNYATISQITQNLS